MAYGHYQWSDKEQERIRVIGAELQAAITTPATPAHNAAFDAKLEAFELATTPLSVIAAAVAVEEDQPLVKFVAGMRELGERQGGNWELFVIKNCKNLGGRTLKFRCAGVVDGRSGELPIESLPEVARLVEQAQASGVPGERVGVMLDKVSQLIGGVA